MSRIVIGHKNPDTDAICSAIAYADFLCRTGIPDAIPARCGELNSRTAYVLEQAGVEPPRLIMDVRPTAGRICQRLVITAGKDDSLLEAFNLMRPRSLRSIPVLDNDRRILGMVSLQKIMELLLPDNGGLMHARIVQSNLGLIAKVLEGTFLHSVNPTQNEEFTLTVGALSAEVFVERLKLYRPEQILLVAGDRPTVQRSAIEYGVRALVVTGNCPISADLLDLARERNVSVITSPHDTATTTLLIKFAKSISLALTSDFKSFGELALVKNIRTELQDSSQPLFPVLDEENRLAGVFSKTDLLHPAAVRLVLVDHNEFGQAVTGAEDAEIVEVLDHHRLGGSLTSIHPIRFINEPVGSTCTIVARSYRQAGLKPQPGIALCMASGIISDTLNLTSPTTTPIDREILGWLNDFCTRPLNLFAADFFAAGSVLQMKGAAEIVQSDCKEYEENDWKFAVAQIEELGLDDFWKRQDDLLTALEDRVRKNNLDLACLLITDITRHYSLLLVAGDPTLLALIDYPHLSHRLFELDGIVSRKKQLLPHIMSLLGKVHRK